MGLTIHYALKSGAETVEQARRQIDLLRKRALDLPFSQVGEVIELAGSECDYHTRAPEDPHRWLLIQAEQSVECGSPEASSIHYRVPPIQLIAFETMPGSGCEAANFGLCRYPATVQISGEARYVSGHGYVHPRRRIPTGLAGWRWGSFCKTQYASNPECGGVENFLRCHLSVIRLLDQARALGVLDAVSDEGDFWQNRNIQALAEEVGQWNQMLAAFVGELKDQLGDNLEAAITTFPDFEHLEAKGRSAR